MKILGQKTSAVHIILLAVLVLLTLTIVFPLLCILFSAKVQDYVHVFTQSALQKAIKNTFLLCITSSSLSVFFGFVYAYGIVRLPVPCKKFFATMPILHLITPPFVGGLAFILLFGRQGFITHTLLRLDVSLYGFSGLVIAQVLCFFPLAYLMGVQTISNINRNIEKSAENLGAKKLRIFASITLPLCTPGIIASFLFVAVSVLSDFGNPLIIGGRYRVLAVEIYTQLAGWLNRGTSAVLGLVLVVPSIALFLLQNRLYRGMAKKTATIDGKLLFDKSTITNGTKTSTATKIATFFTTLCMALLSLLIIAQVSSIIVGSFQKLWGINTSFTLEHIKALPSFLHPLCNSLLYALLSALLSTIIATLSAFLVQRINLPCKKYLDTVIQLPSSIPGSLLGLALSLSASMLNIRFAPLLIIIVMTISFMPFSYRIITQTFSSIKSILDDSATSLGAKPLQTLCTVLVPLSEGGFFFGFMYNFIRGVGTLSGVIFLVSFNTPLASISIINLAEQGNWGKAASLALALTVLTFALLALALLFTKLSKKRKRRLA